jgi:hypothetical protein
MPDWSSDARVLTLLSMAEPALADREMRSGERRYFDRNVPRDLKRVVRYAADSDSLLDMLTAVFRNQNFDARNFCMILNEVEIAFAEVAEFDCNTIAKFAMRAAGAAEDFNNWRELFNQMLRPAPPAQQPHQRPARPGECPLDRERARRNPHIAQRNPQARRTAEADPEAPVPDNDD